jgi:hypothetical protein
MAFRSSFMLPSSVPKQPKTTTKTLIMKAVSSYAIRYPFTHSCGPCFKICISSSSVVSLSEQLSVPFVRWAWNFRRWWVKFCLPKFFHGTAKSVRNLLCYKHKLTKMDTGHVLHVLHAGRPLAYHAEILKISEHRLWFSNSRFYVSQFHT